MSVFCGFFHPWIDFLKSSETYEGILHDMLTVLPPCTNSCHTLASSFGYHGSVIPEHVSSLFLAQGTGITARLTGSFAYALYSENEERLYLFRDPLGSVPLYYTIYRGMFLFSTHLSSLLAFPNMTATLDHQGTCELLGLGPAHSPGLTLFHGIFEVLPGSYLTVGKGGQWETCYYAVHAKPHEEAFDETVEHTRSLIASRVRSVLPNDASEPVGALLSGGLDSSLVCALADRELDTSLVTFSLVMKGNEHFPYTDQKLSLDEPFAVELAERLGSEHHTITCDASILINYLEASVNAHGVPCMADIDSSLLYFLGQIGYHNSGNGSIQYLLTGEGADEIFAGYPWFHRETMQRTVYYPWSPDLTPRVSILNPETACLLDLENYVHANCQKLCLRAPLLPEDTYEMRRSRQLAYLTTSVFLPTLLSRMYTAATEYSLTPLLPFVDGELVSYLYNVPWQLKSKDGVVKGLLREVSKGFVPENIRMRPKSPYPKTYQPLYTELLLERVSQLLKDSSNAVWELFDRASIRTLMLASTEQTAPWFGQLMTRPQMLAYLLQIEYWLRHFHVTIRL